MSRSQNPRREKSNITQAFTSIFGDTENNTLNGNADNNLIYGSAGNDAISGGDGYDVLTYKDTGRAISLLRGGTILQGNMYTDQITDFSIEKIIGPRGFNNTIDGSSGSTAFIDANSQTGLLTINGLPGIGSASIEFENFRSFLGTQNSDILTGSRNDEQFDGSSGDDYIQAGGGRDQLTGGFGNDIFAYERGHSTLSQWDTITDFSVSEDFIQWEQEITQMIDIGFVNKLRQRDINALLEKNNFTDGTAAFMRTIDPREDIERSFLMINDSKDGFQERDDAMIEITGFTGSIQEINFI